MRSCTLTLGSLAVVLALSACAGELATAADGDADGDGAPDAAPGVDAAPDHVDEVLAALPARCTPRAVERPDCAALAATFDPETWFCRDGDEAVGAFPAALRARCRADGGGDACDGDRWNRAFLLRLLDQTGLTDVPIEDAFAAIWARGDVYCRPTAQDGEGNGIWQDPSGDVPEAARSEAPYPPFVLGPRRQVDSLVRQLYLALPAGVRASTAFVIADRFVQEPEAYARYVRSRQKVVIAGSFVGIGASQSVPDWARARHADELWKLRASIALVHALGRDVADVVYAMGDSPTTAGLAVREALDERLHRTLAAAGLGGLDTRVTWGADETIAVAFARALPEATVRLHVANPAARHHYDGERRTDEILAEKLPQLGLPVVDGAGDADLELAVLGRRPGGGNADYQAGDAAQASFDADFMAQLAALPEARWQRLAIVDGRLFNGAWDRRSVPARCDLLAFGAWGTFGNNVGMTAAAAKILRGAPAAVRRQLYIEAVAHDVVANGYAEAQRGALRDRVNAALGAGAFKHFAGYATAGEVGKVFAIVNDLVQERLAVVLPCAAGAALRFTPQLWRTFESEVHLGGGPLDVPGVFRTDLPAPTFDPRRPGATSLTLADLIAGT